MSRPARDLSRSSQFRFARLHHVSPSTEVTPPLYVGHGRVDARLTERGGRHTTHEPPRISVLPASSLASRHAWIRSGRSTRYT